MEYLVEGIQLRFAWQTVNELSNEKITSIEKIK